MRNKKNSLRSSKLTLIDTNQIEDLKEEQIQFSCSRTRINSFLSELEGHQESKERLYLDSETLKKNTKSLQKK